MRKKHIRRGFCLLFCLILALAPLHTRALSTHYERLISEGLAERYDLGETVLRLDAAADWDMSFQTVSELVSSLLPHNFLFSVEGDDRFVTYVITPTDTHTRHELEQLAAARLEQMITPGMSDTEKLRAMHDWLVLNTAYNHDAAASSSGDRYSYVYTVEGPLIYGSAVCDGYSRTLLMLCRLEGIPCIRISSETLGHSYNAVLLEGTWRIIDVTWDDPDQGDTVYYNNFLKRPSEMTVHLPEDGSGTHLPLEEYFDFAQAYYGVSEVPAPLPSALDGRSQAELADLLRAQGLFVGTDLGYELGRAPTRAELAVLFVRVLGREAAALTAPVNTPFTDLPAWAAPHISDLYGAGLARGMSENLFGAQAPAAARDYATFLLRAMGYREGIDFDWATAMETAAAMSFAPAAQTPGSFTRGDAVEMTARALAVPMAKTGRTLAGHLAQLGALDLQLAYAQGLIPA